MKWVKGAQLAIILPLENKTFSTAITTIKNYGNRKTPLKVMAEQRIKKDLCCHDFGCTN